MEWLYKYWNCIMAVMFSLFFIGVDQLSGIIPCFLWFINELQIIELKKNLDEVEEEVTKWHRKFVEEKYGINTNNE